MKLLVRAKEFIEKAKWYFFAYLEWLTSDLLPWLSPFMPLVIGALLSTSALHFFPHDSTEAFLIALQIVGASLTVGALIMSGLEARIDPPLATLKSWLISRPSRPLYRSANSIGGAFGVFPGPTIQMSMSSLPARDSSQSEINRWLIDRISSMEGEQFGERLRVNSKLEELTSRIEGQNQQLTNTHHKLNEDIRKISTSNFYQVLVGLIMISVGSICSALLAV